MKVNDAAIAVRDQTPTRILDDAGIKEISAITRCRLCRAECEFRRLSFVRMVNC